MTSAGDASAGDKRSREEKLAFMLKAHQRIVYRQENVSKYFSDDPEMENIATQCWEQINGQVCQMIQDKYQMVLREFHVVDKLSHLNELEKEHQSSKPAWRPSGNPQEDFTQAAGAVIRLSAIQEFEKMYTEVQGVTSKLQEMYQENQQELAALAAQLKEKTDYLNSESNFSTSQSEDREN